MLVELSISLGAVLAWWGRIRALSRNFMQTLLVTVSGIFNMKRNMVWIWDGASFGRPATRNLDPPTSRAYQWACRSSGAERRQMDFACRRCILRSKRNSRGWPSDRRMEIISKNCAWGSCLGDEKSKTVAQFNAGAWFWSWGFLLTWSQNLSFLGLTLCSNSLDLEII